MRRTTQLLFTFKVTRGISSLTPPNGKLVEWEAMANRVLSTQELPCCPERILQGEPGGTGKISRGGRRCGFSLPPYCICLLCLRKWTLILEFEVNAAPQGRGQLRTSTHQAKLSPGFRLSSTHSQQQKLANAEVTGIFSSTLDFPIMRKRGTLEIWEISNFQHHLKSFWLLGYCTFTYLILYIGYKWS